MVNIVYSELLKLKRSKMLWLIAIGAFLPALLNFFVAIHRLDNGATLKWTEYFHDDLMLMAMLMCPALFALFTGYLFAREYQERTANSLLTVARPRIGLLFGKYIVMVPVMAATLALSFALTLAGGFLLRHEGLAGAVLLDAVWKYLLLLVLQYALVSIAATVSILGKSYIPAMGLGVFAVISELTIMQSKYIMYYPWSAPLNLLLHLSPKYDNTALGVTVLAAAFIVPLLFNMAYYRNADVHSG